MATMMTDVRPLVPGADRVESANPAIAWSAIFGGTVAALAASLVLFSLGSGFGLAWAGSSTSAGTSATALTIVAVVWLIVSQWIASGLGGYLTGRLRTKWVTAHTHEVFFRDTAHGFLTWAAGTVIGLVVLALVSFSLVGAAARSTTTIGSALAPYGDAALAAAPNSAGDGQDYEVERLFRNSQPGSGETISAPIRSEAMRIVARGLSHGNLAPADRSYLSGLVAARSGLSVPDAEKRVDDVIAKLMDAKAKAAETANAARAAAAKFNIFSAVSMLMGAFIACVAAALGGRQRDEHP